MNRLRQALGDTADKPRFIETLARGGCRWMVPVEWDVAPASHAGPAPQEPRSQPVRRTEAHTADADEKPVHAITPALGNLTGKKVSHYRALDLLGGGGMGVVYPAEDIKLGRVAALKFLPEELTNEGKAVERFEREARA